MRRSLLVLLILLLSSGALASGYAIWTYVSGEQAESAAEPIVPLPSTASKAAPTEEKRAALPSLPAPSPSAASSSGASARLAIEVARIDAGGPSVLAGRAPPNHTVTLRANGREIASVTATDEGQWSAIVSEGIAAGPLELSIVSQPKDGGAAVHGAVRQLEVPAAAPSLATAPPMPPHAAHAPAQASQPVAGPAKSPAQREAKGDAAPNKRALAEFEALVERTRKEVAAQAPSSAPVAAAATATAPQIAQAQAAGAVPAPAVVAPESAQASAATAPESRMAAAVPSAASPGVASPVRAAAATPPTLAAAQAPAPAAAQAPIPLPITFMTNEAMLTADGERAAALLAEYVRLKQPAGITLSGHADARGPDGYNMRLSLRRLEAIERYLRAAGYKGALSLVPRGKREPYRGIDRTRLPRHLIHQADRRVELRLTP